MSATSARSKIRSKGKKPAAAFGNQEAAYRNIKAKLDGLREALNLLTIAPADSEEKRIKLLSHLKELPQSVRRFNAWTGKSESTGGTTFRTNAQETLKLSGQYEAVEDLVSLTKRVESQLNAPSPKVATLASVRRKLELSNVLREIAERELFTQKRVNKQLASRLEAQIRLYTALKREMSSAKPDDPFHPTSKGPAKPARAARVIPIQRPREEV